jgi:hypothetical protein
MYITILIKSFFLQTQTLMDQENGWYDGPTDSIIISAHIAADAPLGVKLVVVNSGHKDQIIISG